MSLSNLWTLHLVDLSCVVVFVDFNSFGFVEKTGQAGCMNFCGCVYMFMSACAGRVRVSGVGVGANSDEGLK